VIKKSTRKSECLSAELHRANQQMVEWKQQLELVLKDYCVRLAAAW